MASITSRDQGWFWSPGRLLMVLLWFYSTLHSSVDGSILSEAESWLREYGYLPSAYGYQSSSMPYLSTQDLSKAISDMQRFYKLPVTGQMNQQTMRAMKQPRCGFSDSTINATKWDKYSLTFRVENFAPNIARQDTLEAIRKAFQVWENASPFTFEEIYSGNNVADIKVSFQEGLPGPFQTPEVAHAHSPTDHLVEGDVHFNSHRQWIRMDQNVQGSFNLFLVAVHEIGHSLGLGHSSDAASIMHPSYHWEETEDFQLPADVRQSIQQMYIDCPSGWKMFGGSCYYRTHTQFEWQGGRDYCLGQGADLAVINSGEEQAFVGGLELANYGSWIGVRWTGRRWTWVDGTRLTTEYWGVGEPDDVEGRDCAANRLDSTDNIGWANYACSTKNRVICEK